MANSFFNLVTFTATTPTGDKRLYLTLEDNWTWGPGAEPNVNTATVPYTEFEKLGPDVGDIIGTVEFWFHNTPGGPAAPDARYELIRLVDVEATKFGTPITLNPAGGIQGGSLAPRPIEYKLTFADVRERFTWPRGGVLNQGEINKEPLDDATGLDANGQIVRRLRQLVTWCLSAMGASNTNVPFDLDALAAPKNLEWRMSHAPTELKKLLAPTPYVVTLGLNGSMSIQRIGDGNLPAISTDQVLPIYTHPVVDRRGKYVVFTSGPNGTISTETISGGKGDSGATTWQFVILDPDIDAWVPQDEAWCFSKAGKTAADAMKDDGIGWIKETYRQRVLDQLYRYIRLNPDVYGPAPLQRTVRETGKGESGDPKSKDAPISISAVIARSDGSGIWTNTTDKVEVNVVGLENSGQVIHAAERLLKISTDQSYDPRFDLRPLDDGELEVRCTREVLEKNEVWSPQYFNVGFTAGPGGAVELGDNELKNVLAGPEATIVRRPELVLQRVDGEETNRAELVAAAAALAGRFLRGSASTTKIVTARGFASAETNGLVSEVKISQSSLITTLKINTWWLPSSEHYVQAEEIQQAIKGEKFPLQADTQNAKLSAGHSGATQPSVPVMPSSTPPVAPTEVLVKMLGNLDAAGKYYGGLVTGRSTADADTDEAMPEGMTDPTKPSLEILNLEEDPATGAITKHRLPPGYYLAKVIGSGPGGLIVAIQSQRCGASDTATFIGVDDTTLEAPDPVHVEAVDTLRVQEKRLVRVAYKADADVPTLLAFFRVYNYKCGRLTDISAEYVKTVVSTCAGGG